MPSKGSDESKVLRSMKELIYFIAFHFEKKRKGDSYNYNKHVVKYEVDFFTHSTIRGA